MKLLLLVLCITLSGGLAEPQAPYPASGWRPEGRAFELPERRPTQYLPPVQPRTLPRDIDDDVAVQGLPGDEQLPQFQGNGQYQPQRQNVQRQPTGTTSYQTVVLKNVTPRQFTTRPVFSATKPTISSISTSTTTQSDLNEGEDDTNNDNQQNNEQEEEKRKTQPPETILTPVAQIRLQTISPFVQNQSPFIQNQFVQQLQESKQNQFDGIDGRVHLAALQRILSQQNFAPQSYVQTKQVVFQTEPEKSGQIQSNPVLIVSQNILPPQKLQSKDYNVEPLLVQYQSQNFAQNRENGERQSNQDQTAFLLQTQVYQPQDVQVTTQNVQFVPQNIQVEPQNIQVVPQNVQVVPQSVGYQPQYDENQSDGQARQFVSQNANYPQLNIQYQDQNVQYQAQNVQYETQNVQYKPQNVQVDTESVQPQVQYQPNVQYQPQNVQVQTENVQPEIVQYQQPNVQFQPQSIQFTTQTLQLQPQNVQYQAPTKQTLPQNVEYQPQIVQLQPVNVQLQPQNVQVVPQNVQVVPQNVPVVPQNVQVLPQNLNEQNDYQNVQQNQQSQFDNKENVNYQNSNFYQGTNYQPQSVQGQLVYSQFEPAYQQFNQQNQGFAQNQQYAQNQQITQQNQDFSQNQQIPQNQQYAQNQQNQGFAQNQQYRQIQLLAQNQQINDQNQRLSQNQQYAQNQQTNDQNQRFAQNQPFAQLQYYQYQQLNQAPANQQAPGPLQSGLDVNKQGNDLGDERTTDDENDDDDGEKEATTKIYNGFGDRTRPRYGVPIPKQVSTTPEVSSDEGATTENASRTDSPLTPGRHGRRKSSKLRNRRVRPVITVDNSGHLVLSGDQA